QRKTADTSPNTPTATLSLLPDAWSSHQKREFHSRRNRETLRNPQNALKIILARFLVALDSALRFDSSSVEKRIVVTAYRFAIAAMLTIFICASASGQYTPGQRVWTPPTFGNYFSLLSGGTNFPPAPFFPYDAIQVPVYSLNGSNSFLYD